MEVYVANRAVSMVFWLCMCVLMNLAEIISAEKPPCIMKGHLYTQLPWYGYLVQKTFQTDTAKIKYQLSYPANECCLNLLIYYDDQLRHLKEGMTCSEREQVLPPDNNQIIPLIVSNKTKGCTIKNETDGPVYICVGERTFKSTGPRTWYFAVSRCNSQQPLSLWYFFNITGYYGDCEADPLAKTNIPIPINHDEDQYLTVSIALGVVAGAGILASTVFFALWCFNRRLLEKKGKKGNESMTSSQATMTVQDIFYVNPSISERDTSDYSRSSSENYYEIIPERRSYESVDTNNMAVIPYGHHMHHNGLRHHHHHHPGHIRGNHTLSHTPTPQMGTHLAVPHHGTHSPRSQTLIKDPRHANGGIQGFRPIHPAPPPSFDESPPPPYPLQQSVGGVGRQPIVQNYHPGANNNVRYAMGQAPSPRQSLETTA